jgi:cellulose synthase/poly-beta-1,6-N-acetylglucosamine synthase-like glycosyltransferase
MMPWWALAVLIFGANFAVWGFIGLCRRVAALTRKAGAAAPHPAAEGGTVVVLPGTGPVPGAAQRMTVQDVAVLIAAHNEAMVIEQSLHAIMELVPPGNVHVVSDGSTDRTVDVARRAGVNVIETKENLGKAGALHEAIQRFGLLDRYRAVMLLDADTRVQPGYFDAALPIFDTPGVVAVAGCVKTDYDRKLTLVGSLLIGHRQRIYAVGQRVMKYGQTSRRINATPIVPGFASIYRSDVLPRIDMNPPGLAIEDFNMTFEVYQKRLGKVGFTLQAIAVTQDPDNLTDYIRQTKRWALGLWQTVRRHSPRANLFSAMVALLLLEAVTSSLMYLLLPMTLLVIGVPQVLGGAQFWPWFAPLYTAVAAHVRLSTMFFGVVVPDYALTIVVAVLERRPRLLLAGFLFPVLRVVDAAIGIYAIPMAWLSQSNGRWRSPARSIAGTSQRAMAGPGPAVAEYPTLSPVRLAHAGAAAGPAGAGNAVRMGDVRHASG